MSAQISVSPGAFTLLPLYILLSLFSLSLGFKGLEYDLQEGLPRSSFVGDVLKDSNLTREVPAEQIHRLRFELRKVSDYSYFLLEEQSGVLRVAHVIDREEICLHRAVCDLVLEVRVKPGEFFQIIKIIIHVTDVNDNAPSFPRESVEMSVMETTSPGALFVIPTAVDADSGSLGIQEYRLISSSDVFDLQTTDYMDGSKDLRLKLMKRLDREIQDSYVMTVLAVDGGNPKRTGSIILDVRILDSNDNNPKFDNASYGVTIHENLPEDSLVATVRATDPDAGQSGAVVYSLSENSEREYGKIFRIDERTGEIYLKTSVDYEQAKSYQLTVVATDLGTGSLPAFANVIIDILDLNDNPPVISVNALTGSGRAEVRENSEPGTFVAHAAVRDVDEGEGGKTSCSIDGRGMFRLESLYDSEFKVVTSVTFDREKASTYILTLTCRDNGIPSLTSSATLEVLILDENDHSPVLSADVLTAEIRENTPSGHQVIILNATDADSGRNGAVLYQMRALDESSENSAGIDPISGAVRTSKVFDYETQNEYRHLVTAYDQGDTRRSATATLILYVVDQNDERPVFSQQSYRFTTTERRPIGTSIGSVNATDYDKSEDFRRISYRIESSGDLPFEIHPNTGEIYISRDLDREISAMYRFVVVAYNKGYSSLEQRVNVSVEVLDVNDNHPVFVYPGRESQTVDIATSSRVGTVVARIVATDADEGMNAELTYSITNGNVDGLFDIHPTTGVIILAKELEDTDTSKLYKLVVLVKDGGETPRTTVTDLRIVANASVAAAPKPPAPASITSLETLFSGSNLMIICGVSAGVLFIVVCLVVVVVCVRRNNRKVRQKLISQMMSTGSPCSYRCQSPMCSSKHSRGKPEGSITTVDTSSLKSFPAGSGHYRHYNCGEFRGSVVEGDGEFSDVVTNGPWNHRDAKVIMNSLAEGGGPSSTPLTHRGEPHYCHRARSRSPRSPYSVAGGAGSSSNCSCGSCQLPRRQTPSGGGGGRHPNSRPQSPEYIAMHAVGGHRGHMGGLGEVGADSGSLCSWPDSGRGPSEEEDPQKMQLEPLLIKGKESQPCHCSHQCSHQHQLSPTVTVHFCLPSGGPFLGLAD